ILEALTEVVEIAKLPLDKQTEELDKLEQSVLGRPDSALVKLLLPALAMPLTSFLRSEAELRCASAAFAAERYRRAHGRWPESLDPLVPQFLRAVAKDPFDGKPIRYRRLDD